jgi:hypothetical protein
LRFVTVERGDGAPAFLRQRLGRWYVQRPFASDERRPPDRILPTRSPLVRLGPKLRADSCAVAGDDARGTEQFIV